MKFIKYNKEFMDVRCDFISKDEDIMVGSISCRECKHNKWTSNDEVKCLYDENVIDGNEILYWSCNEDEEHLIHESKKEAIEYYLDDFEEGMEPTKIQVFGYAKIEINEDGIGYLEDLLEYLDSEYGDPDGGWTDPTDAMKKAAKIFVDTVVSEYNVWRCHCVYEEEVNVKHWLNKNG